MAVKLPKEFLEELDSLFDILTKPDAEARKIALTRLRDYERGGRLPLESLIDLAEAPHPAIAMYAITALGRSAHPSAVRKLLALGEKHRQGNTLFLETIVEALGEAASTTATEFLADLLGIRLGWKNKLLGKLALKKDDVSPEELRRRTDLALCVARSLGKIKDPRAAEAIWLCVESADPLVRWHAVQAAMQCELTEFTAKLRTLAKGDPHETVREMAQIALEKLEPLPQPVNN